MYVASPRHWIETNTFECICWKSYEVVLDLSKTQKQGGWISFVRIDWLNRCTVGWGKSLGELVIVGKCSRKKEAVQAVGPFHNRRLTTHIRAREIIMTS